jgi:hypothetical protein
MTFSERPSVAYLRNEFKREKGLGVVVRSRSGTAAVELNNVHTYEVEHFAEQVSEDKLLSRTELAQILGVSKASITAYKKK